MELMGGNIWVESQPGVGTTFAFTLWLETRETPATARPGLPETLGSMRAMVVDDNPTAREILAELLAALPLRCEVVSSGTAALERLQAASDQGAPFDLVFMDWNMPGINGVEAAERIKTSATLTKIPAVVMVTAFGMEEMRTAAEQTRVDGFLVKPVHQSKLADAVAELFGAIPGSASGQNPTGYHAASLQGLRVLLAEDNEVNQQIAVELLQSVGVCIEVARNGAEALRKLQAAPPDRFDVVLMDLQMPVLDGFEATRRLRAEPGFAALPVIAMTAHALEEERQRCLAAGMNGHVSKPIDPDALFRTLEQWAPDRAGHLAVVDSPDASRVAPATPPPPAAPTFEIPGIDTTTALRRVAGNVAAYRRVLLQFCQAQGDAAVRLRASLNAGDTPGAEHIVHGVKGVAGNIGAEALFATTVTLEIALARGEVTEANIVEFASQLDHTIQAIRAAVPGETPPVTAGPVTEPAAVVLDQLASYLTDNDGEAVEHLAAHADLIRASLGGSAFNQLYRALDRFDFSRALAVLEHRHGSQKGDRS
ncbi:hypothetical protein CCP1ISM_540003 [Azospirillaceae bacterium]